MSSSILTRSLEQCADVFKGASRTQLVLSSAAAAVGLLVFKHYQSDYRQWYALGKGGVPHNVAGYLIIQIMKQAGNSDVDSTVQYIRDGEASSLETESFLEQPIPIREGPRPHISKWAGPVRQLSAAAPHSVRKDLISRIGRAAPENITVGKSMIEGGTHTSNALHLASLSKADPARKHSPRGPTELYHVHPTDGSAHAIVSAADAKTLIEAGWAERHVLSGASVGGIPNTYVHIYAPRNTDEIAIHETVAGAAIKYALKKRN